MSVHNLVLHIRRMIVKGAHKGDELFKVRCLGTQNLTSAVRETSVSRHNEGVLKLLNTLELC